MKLVQDWQHLQKKLLAQFACQMGVSGSFPQNTTKLMQLHQDDSIGAHKRYDADHVAKWNFVIWYLQEMHAREISPTLIV